MDKTDASNVERNGDSKGSSFFIVEHHLWNYKTVFTDAMLDLPRKGVLIMTKMEAKVYIQYIKVLLEMKGYTEDVLKEALDMADYALDPEPVVKDPRFEWI